MNSQKRTPTVGSSGQVISPAGPTTSSTVHPGRRKPAMVLAFIRRDLAEGSLFRSALVLDLVYGLINLVSFLFISRTLHRPAAGTIEGAPTYFDFVAVGLAYLLVMQATCAQLISRIQHQQRSGTLEVVAAISLPPGVIAVGVGGYPTMFGMLRSAIYLGCAGVLLGLQFDRTEWVGLAVMMALGSAAALAVGIALAALTIALSAGATAGRMVVVAIGFLSGVYFPTAVLPPVLQWISLVLPTRMAVDGLRAAVAGGPWLGAAVAMTAATSIALALSVLLFGRALARARRIGTLTLA